MITTRNLQTILVLSVAASTVAFDVLQRSTNASVWPSSLASEVHDSSWPEWANTTIRWSTYDAPTFDSVFIPSTPEDLASGVSQHRQAPRILRRECSHWLESISLHTFPAIT